MQHENIVEMGHMHVRIVRNDIIRHQQKRSIIQVQVVVLHVRVDHIQIQHEKVVVQNVRHQHQMQHEHINEVRDRQVVQQ